MLGTFIKIKIYHQRKRKELERKEKRKEMKTREQENCAPCWIRT